jgi:hypothetical protein
VCARRTLALAHNQFTGTVPGCLATLTRLTYFGAWDNYLYGAPPHLRNSLLSNLNADGDSIWSYNCFPEYSMRSSGCSANGTLG